jgi:hypothetical protein
MDPEQLQASLRSSRGELDQAESALASLLRDLSHTSRAEKRTIGGALQRALDNVRAARRQLDLLEQAARPRDEST